MKTCAHVAFTGGGQYSGVGVRQKSSEMSCACRRAAPDHNYPYLKTWVKLSLLSPDFSRCNNPYSDFLLLLYNFKTEFVFSMTIWPTTRYNLGWTPIFVGHWPTKYDPQFDNRWQQDYQIRHTRTPSGTLRTTNCHLWWFATRYAAFPTLRLSSGAQGYKTDSPGCNCANGYLRFAYVAAGIGTFVSNMIDLSWRWKSTLWHTSHIITNAYK